MSTVTVHIGGEHHRADAGTSLAALLWAAGRRSFSSHPVTGAPRGPLCGMGSCQECEVWVRTDRGPARRARACLEPAVDGLVVDLELPAPQ